MTLTPAQQEAIQHQGNTLVMAGAGTGKTRTLVQRCVDRLLNPDHSVGLDEILVVTFTEAAAAEIRQRIRAELERQSQDPEFSDRNLLARQMAVMDNAHICTLHSFCLKLVQQHFHELEIDPQLVILADEQTALLAQETLDQIFRQHYESEAKDSLNVMTLLQDQVDGWDDRLKELILDIHHFTQTRPDPEGWFDRQLEQYAQSTPLSWRSWWVQGFKIWRQDWLGELEQQSQDNPAAASICKALKAVDHPQLRAEVLPHELSESDFAGIQAQISSASEEIARADEEDWPKGAKTRLRKALVGFFKEASFLKSLIPESSSSGKDPMVEDWNWVRTGMSTLLGLAREFGQRFALAKRERGQVDFHDLEQFSLRLLWDSKADQETDLAREWRHNLKLVFVDEYQDINEAQDKILTALSRSDAEANRFLVGDVKQSIYRFRQAAPHIFQNYASAWEKTSSPGQTVWLSDNFRSREALLDFINPFFGAVMRPELGGVTYDSKAQLNFGNPDGRPLLSRQPDHKPRVEVNLLLQTKNSESESVEDKESPAPAAPSVQDLTSSEKEARLIAQRLLALKNERHQVWDDEQKQFRDVDWNDMVILLRAPSGKVESFAKEFARHRIPLHAKRTGFFDSIEVLDLVNLLQLLDNPLDDLPTVAVLRSPLVGLTLDELAAIRLCAPKVHFWTALQRWHKLPASARDERVGFEKVDSFLKQYHHWRSQSRHASLPQRLELVVQDTHYLDWLLTQSRGEQRQANVAQLLALAREFDEMHAQGLHRFLMLIQAQQKAAGDREPAVVDTDNAVRLMSIHQSKGLEFPVVVAADLGKRFNLASAKGGILLDEHFGLCPSVKPPENGRSYPSLPLWLARRRQKDEALGEEIRLLYVALTRAQDTLILTGCCTAKTARETWPSQAESFPQPQQLLKARSYLDWLGPWFCQHNEHSDWTEQAQGQTVLWSWNIQEENASQPPETGTESNPVEEPELPASSVVGEEEFQQLVERIAWVYPHQAQTTTPAKASVTSLRRRFNDETESETVQAPYLEPRSPNLNAPSEPALAASQIGLAHHKFLQWMDLTQAIDSPTLESQAQRLVESGHLTEDERKGLRLSEITTFWEGQIGRTILQHSDQVHRELPFTIRLDSSDLSSLDLPPVEGIVSGEHVVVQGVIDLAVIREREIWLLDFKTDRMTEKDSEKKLIHYRPQMQLYALALRKIFALPVKQSWLHFFATGQTVEV
jgi:ATP-dependent helicase/nuclease subunit A